MNPVFDSLQRKMVSGPEAGQNTEVNGFEVSFIGSTDGTVYNAGDGLTLTGNVFAANVADVGFGMELAGGTASYERYRAIETVTGATVTLMAGYAFKSYATATPLHIETETIPANHFGLEGHLEVFVGSTGYVITGTNVILADPLEPDAVNNCTVRFHDGIAIISVEDHIAGYVVISATGSTAGTLPYALSSATQEYVTFDAALNGSALDMSGAVTNGEKHIVGNGYADTILTGGITCTSQTTFANLAMSGGAIVASGSLTLEDGCFAVDSVSGSGPLFFGRNAILDLTNNANITPIAPGGGITFAPGGATVYPSAGSAAAYTIGGGTFTAITNGVYSSGGSTYPGQLLGPMSFTNGEIISGNAIVNLAQTHRLVKSGLSLTLNGLTFVGGSATGGGVMIINSTGKATFIDCVLSGNYGKAGGAIYVNAGALCELSGCTVDGNSYASGGDVFVFGGTVTIAGVNSLGFVSGTSGSVIISSGASINLTSSIALGGGVIVLEGGCTANGHPIVASTYTSIASDGTTVPPQPE